MSPLSAAATIGNIQIQVIDPKSDIVIIESSLKESKSIFKLFSENIFKIFNNNKKYKNNQQVFDDKNSTVIDLKSNQDKYENDEEEKKWGKYTGMFLAILSSFVFSITALLVKHLQSYNPITIALWRFQGALWPALPFFIHHLLSQEKVKQQQQQKTKTADFSQERHGHSKLKMFTLVLARSVLSCNSLLLNFYSLKYLDIGDALVISSSTPIFVTLVAHKVLGEKCGLVPIVSAIFTLLGVIVISRPPHLTGEEEFDLNSLIGTSLALGCMILATVSYVILRYIRTLHFSVTAVGFGAWGTIENLTLAIVFGVLSLPEGSNDWCLAAGLILLTFIGQVFVILAFKCEQAGFVSLFKTSDVVFAFLWQIIFLGRIPDQYSFIGTFIIISCISLTAFRKWLSSLPANNSTRRSLRFILM